MFFKNSSTLRMVVVLLLVYVLGIQGVSPAQAGVENLQTGTVYRVSPGGVTSGSCGTDWSTPCDFQYALSIATSGAEIWVQQGTYKPGSTDRSSTFMLKDSVAIYGGFSGTETSLSQRNSDPATNSTVLSGDIGTSGVNSDNAYHVVSANFVFSTAILDGFKITGGNANGATENFGGGIYSANSSPTLNNLIIDANTTNNAGGGMYAVTNHTQRSFYTTPTLTNVVFSNNTATRGGGLYTQNASPILLNVVFSGNTSTSGAGGGMNNQTQTPATDEYSIPQLTNVTFSGNTANGGGGLYNNNSNPTLINVTFSGNTANIRGGAIFNEGASPILKHVTISGNTAPVGFGGGIRNAINGSIPSNPLIENTILWGDTTEEMTSDGTGTITIKDSVIQGGCPSGTTCTNVLSTTPVLSALANNGGFTQTRALGVGSSAINAGGANTTCAPTDQRGAARPQGSACDMGAYEAYILTVTADSKTITYGDSEPTFTFQYSGLAGSDTEAVIDTPPTCGVSGAHTNAGTYTIACSGGADNKYLFFAYVDGTLMINKATPTLSVTNSPVTYDGSTHAANVNGSVLGIMSNILTGGSVTQTNAGTYTVTADFTPTDTTNYNSLTGVSAGDFIINKATPILSVTNSPVTYDSLSHSAVVTTAVPGTISNILTGGSASQTNAGTYAVTANFAPTDTANYNSLTNASVGNFVINKATPTLSVTNSPVTYDGSLHSATVTGSILGSVSNILTGGSASQTNAGTYPVTADFLPADTTNYNSLTTASAGNFIINKVTPTISVSNSSATYDGLAQFAIVTGSVPGTPGNILVGGSASQTNAGTYAVTADFVPTDTTNYNSLTSAPAGNFTIDKATPTISVSNSPATYNGLAQSATVTGSVPGVPSNILTGGSASQINAGTYTVTASFVPTDTANYNSLTNVSAGNFIINKATPVLSVTNSPVSYNGLPHSASVSNSVPGTVSNILTGGSASQTNAGTYAVTANFMPTDTANYNSLTNASAGNFIINKITPTLSVMNSPVLFDGSPHSATVDSSVPGTISNILTGGSATQTNVGTYPVTADFSPTDTVNYNNLIGASAGNFVISADITPPDTQLNIRPASPSGADVAFTFSSTDGTATFECQLDGGGFSACISPKNYTGLANGSHTFEVRAKDPANNVDATPSTYTWTVAVNTSGFMGSAIVAPSSLIAQGGSTNGLASSLGFFEQSGPDDDAGAYVLFQTPGVVFVGHRSFHIPDDIQTNLISNALLQVNVNGPASSTQIWTWSIYDWNSNLWIKLGDTIGSTADQWNSMTFSIRNIQNYISPTREVRIQLRSSNDINDLKMDYEALHLTYRSVTITPTPSAPSMPMGRPGIASAAGSWMVR